MSNQNVILDLINKKDIKSYEEGSKNMSNQFYVTSENSSIFQEELENKADESAWLSNVNNSQGNLLHISGHNIIKSMDKSPKLKSGRNSTTTLSTNRVELNRIIRCSTNVLLNKSKILKSQDIEWDRQIPGEWDQHWHITLQNNFVKISDWHTSYVLLLVQQAKIAGSLHEHCVNVKCRHLQRTCRIIQARYSGYIISSSRSNDQFVQGVSRNDGQIFC